MAEYLLMQMLYSSSSSVRPISDIFVSIVCSYTFLKQLYCQFLIIIIDLVSGKKETVESQLYLNYFVSVVYTGGLYIALRKYDDFK